MNAKHSLHSEATSFIICETYGGVAQLGEHLPCKQGVKGAIPFISTIGCKTENVVHKELKQRSKVNLGCAKQ